MSHCSIIYIKKFFNFHFPDCFPCCPNQYPMSDPKRVPIKSFGNSWKNPITTIATRTAKLSPTCIFRFNRTLIPFLTEH